MAPQSKQVRFAITTLGSQKLPCRAAIPAGQGPAHGG